MFRISSIRAGVGLFATAMAFLVGVFALLPSQAHAYSNDRLIDDGIFLNAQSMTPGQIQNFLISKGSALTGVTVVEKSTTETLSYYPHYNQTVSAAQAIYDAGQVYGINPQVILATLQKEQSLITDPDPADSQLRFAMGYGCPDSSGCSSTSAGFFYQIDNGTWALRQRYEQANRNNSWWRPNMNFPCSGSNTTFYSPGLYAGNTVAFYDGNNPPSKNPRVAYATFRLNSAATASLYCYTPHAYNNPQGLYGNPAFGTTGQYYSGSYNFVKSFENWFGSTQFPQPTGGKLLYQTSTGKIYLVTDTNRYYIPSWSIMTNYGLDGYPVMPSTDATLQQYTDAGNLTNLVYNSGGVYLVNDKVLYHLSPDICTAWGLSCFDSAVVQALGPTFQTGYLTTSGELSELSASNGVIYRMVAGTRRPIANPKTLSDLGLGSTAVLAASAANSTQPLGPLLVTTPGVIQLAPSSPLYYFDGTSYYRVPNMTSYSDWALERAPLLDAPVSSYSTTLPSSAVLSSYTTVSGAQYIIDQGRRLVVPASLDKPWRDALFTAVPSALFNTLPSSTLSPYIYSSSGIFVLGEGEKHYVSSIDDFAGLGVNSANLANIRSDKMTEVNNGVDALPDGKLILTPENGKIYVVNNHKLTYIPGPSIFNAYGYDWGKIFSYPASAIVSDYPLDPKPLGVSMKNSTGDVFLVGASTLYRLPTGWVTDFGLNSSSSLHVVSNQAIKKNNVTQLPRFLYNGDNGRIYYASGEALHYVSGMASFVAYGGFRTTLATVDNQIISQFTIAQPI